MDLEVREITEEEQKIIDLQNKLVVVETDGEQWKQNYFLAKKFKQDAEQKLSSTQAELSGWKAKAEQLEAELKVLKESNEDLKVDLKSLETETDDEIFTLEDKSINQTVEIDSLRKKKDSIEGEYSSLICILTKEFLKGDIELPDWLARYLSRNIELEVNRP